MSVLLVYFLLQGQNMMQAFIFLINTCIEVINQPLLPAFDRVIGVAANIFLRFMGAMGGALIVVTLIGVIAQIGPLWASEAIQPKFDKLNIISNFKQIFSLKSLFEFIKNCLKVLLLSVVFYYLLSRYSSSLQFLPLCGPACGLLVTCTLVSWLWGAFLASYLVFAIADYAFQRYSIMKELKMSKEDIKQEFKDSEGSPEIKSKRQDIHREIQSGSLAAKVKRSSVVVRNPTHLAICLYYCQGKTPLPTVLEKAQDKRALYLVELAEKAGIPVVENIPLARALHNAVDPGEYIPEELFEPVAALLRAVMAVSYDEEE